MIQHRQQRISFLHTLSDIRQQTICFNASPEMRTPFWRHAAPWSWLHPRTDGHLGCHACTWKNNRNRNDEHWKLRTLEICGFDKNVELDFQSKGNGLAFNTIRLWQLLSIRFTLWQLISIQSTPWQLKCTMIPNSNMCFLRKVALVLCNHKECMLYSPTNIMHLQLCICSMLRTSSCRHSDSVHSSPSCGTRWRRSGGEDHSASSSGNDRGSWCGIKRIKDQRSRNSSCVKKGRETNNNDHESYNRIYTCQQYISTTCQKFE